MNKFIQDKKIKEIDKFLYESYKKVNMYKYLTPTNLLEENSKFLEKYGAGVEYNPTYLYKDIKDVDVNTILNEIFKYRDELNKIGFESDNNQLIKREIRMLEDLENMIYLSNNIGNEDSKVEIYSKKIYGEPDKKLIEKAKMVLEKDYKDREICSHNAKEVKELFEQILKEIDLKWKINVNKVQSSKISVIPEEKVININEKVMFSNNDLKRLAVHEIGTHVLRAEYGSNQPYKMFSIECGSALYTEEGSTPPAIFRLSIIWADMTYITTSFSSSFRRPKASVLTKLSLSFKAVSSRAIRLMVVFFPFIEANIRKVVPS